MLDLVESKLSQHEAFRADVLAGLSQRQKTLPSRWLYDQRGSELFEEITHLDEYYLTRTETAILRRHGCAHPPDADERRERPRRTQERRRAGLAVPRQTRYNERAPFWGPLVVSGPVSQWRSSECRLAQGASQISSQRS